MTSKKTKQKRLESSAIIKAKLYSDIDTTDEKINPPPGSVLADQSELKHNNTYGALPLFYVDKLVICRTCKKEEVWKAENQKWWYEEIKGNINTQAVLCRQCRKKEKIKKEHSRKIHMEGLDAKNHSNET